MTHKFFAAAWAALVNFIGQHSSPFKGEAGRGMGRKERRYAASL